MEQRFKTKQPRIFSATNWGYTILPLLGLMLPSSAFAAADEFSFDGTAPEPDLDLIDIAPGMVQHFGSTLHHLGRQDLMIADDGSSFVAPTDAADSTHDAHIQHNADGHHAVPMHHVDDIAG